MLSDPQTTEEPRWLDVGEQRAWWALLEVGSGLFDTISAELKQLAGLTLDDYEVLHLLSQAPRRRLRVGELADTMLTGRTRLSQRIDRLTDRGWVERMPCPEDRRAIWVVLTDAGFEFLASIAPAHLEHVRTHVFDHLTATDVAHLGESLTKIAQHLHDERRSS
jgi:DNA-binding MarR family transcriptional regulator